MKLKLRKRIIAIVLEVVEEVEEEEMEEEEEAEVEEEEERVEEEGVVWSMEATVEEVPLGAGNTLDDTKQLPIYVAMYS